MMNEKILGYIIIVTLSVVTGIFGNKVFNYRKSVKDLRDRISDGVSDGGDLSESKQRFEGTIEEIRKNQQIDG